jgi:hypothetical protein
MGRRRGLRAIEPSEVMGPRLRGDDDQR